VTHRANTGDAAEATILLARHGETDWNRERRWQGVSDLALNERGREQARALAETLQAVPLGAVYASDLRRAYETALVVAEAKGLAVTPMPELREVDVGSWTGLLYDDVKERFRDAYTRMRARKGRGWEGGETYAEMGRRVLKAMRRIAREHAGEAVLVVTHSGPIRTVRAHALGLDYATDRKAAPMVDRVELSAVAVADGVFKPADAQIYENLGVGATRPSP
jgi:2,3-bisphosphoglycerate-dependent phosphoglycerate mutase